MQIVLKRIFEGTFSKFLMYNTIKLVELLFSVDKKIIKLDPMIHINILATFLKFSYCNFHKSYSAYLKSYNAEFLALTKYLC